MKKSNKQTKRSKVPKADQISYSGPIHFPNQTTQGIVVPLRERFDIVSSVAGLIFFFDNNNPSASDNWAEYSTAWNEYRVLGIEYKYIPYFKVNTAAVNDAPFVFTQLHSISNPTPTSQAEAWAYGDPKVKTLMDRQTITWRMSSADEADFVSTAVPVADCNTVMGYANGSVSITYGTVFYTYLVQFRNPRK